MKTPKLNSKTNNLFAILLFLVAVGLLLFIAKPSYSAISVNKEEIQNRENERDTKQKELSDLKSLETKYANFVSLPGNINIQNFLQKPTTKDLIEYFYGHTEGNGTKSINSLNFSDSGENEYSFKEKKINLSMNSVAPLSDTNLKNLFAFITGDSENSKYVFFVDSFTYTYPDAPNNSNQTAANQASIQVPLTLYYK